MTTESLQEAGELMIMACQARRLSKSTISFYNQRLASITGILGTKAIAKVTHHDCRRILAESPGKTSEHNYRVLGTLFNFAKREGLIVENPMEKVTRPKNIVKLVQPLTKTEIAKCFKACKADRGGLIGLRDATIFATLLGLGLRRMELCGLTNDDVRLVDGLMRVKGKGGRDRIIPIPSKLKVMLNRWRIARNNSAWYKRRSCESFFLNHDGNAITLNGVTLLLNRLGKRVGVNLHPHRLRHTFATSFMANDGSDIITLQALCGWSTLASVSRYSKVSIDKMARSNEAFSPINDL
jgi:site-specific recombinase XerD